MFARLRSASALSLGLIERLVGVVLLVLVIATTNAARLLRMLVIESVVVALVAGAVALLVAAWTGGALRTLLLSDIHWSSTVIDARVVVFTALLAIIAGAAAGLAPACGGVDHTI